MRAVTVDPAQLLSDHDVAISWSTIDFETTPIDTTASDYLANAERQDI